jgi:hypothetical protein
VVPLQSLVKITEPNAGIQVGVENNYYKFLQKLDKIIKYGQDKKSQKREKLIEEIKNTPGINERDWLLEKLGVGG